MKHFLIAILLALASTAAMAQSDSISITPVSPHGSDTTTKLNPKFDMIAEFPKPPIYDTWFKRLIACEGIPMPPQSEIDKLQFFVINSEAFKTDKASNYTFDAATYTRKHLIIISLPYVWDYDVVAHEFLHFVLWYDYGSKYERTKEHPDVNNHPYQYFGRCDIRPN